MNADTQRVARAQYDAPEPAGAVSGGNMNVAVDVPHRSDRRGKRTLPNWSLGLGAVIVSLALWEAATRLGFLPPEVSTVSEIVEWSTQHVFTAPFWSAVGHTMLQWAGGLVAGGVGGIIAGLVLGTFPLVHRLLNVPLEFVRPIPSIVYLPLALLLMGATTGMAVLIIALGVFFPMLYQTMYGLKAVDPVMLDTGSVFGLSRLQRIVFITLPSALPYIATGVRLAASVALIIAMAVQLTSGLPGLGQRLLVYQQNGVYPGIYAIVAASGVLGLVVIVVIERIERKVLSWHAAYAPRDTT